MNESTVAALESLPALLTSLSEHPYNEPLHYQHVRLSQEAGLPQSEVNSAREMLTTYFAASDDIWLPLLDVELENGKAMRQPWKRLKRCSSALNRTTFVTIPILAVHATFLAQSYEAALNDGTSFLPFNSVNEKLKLLASRGGDDVGVSHLGTSSLEHMAGLDDKCGRVVQCIVFLGSYRFADISPFLGTWKASARNERIELLKVEYLKRITTPHSANHETFQEYSTFVSTYLPASEYESSLVHASQSRQPALAAWRNREQYQTNLYDPQSFQTHLAAEQRKRTKTSDIRVRDPAPIINLYERAIADAAKRKSDALLSGGEGDVKVAEAWLALFWKNYTSFLQDEVDPNKDIVGDIATDTFVLGRAIRSLPSNSDILVAYVHNLELHGRWDQVMEMYQRSTQILLTAEGISDVSFTISASMYRMIRHRQDGDGTLFSGLTEIIEDATKRVRAAGGDDRLKLEKLLVNILLYPSGLPPSDGEDDVSHQAAQSVWEQAVKHNRKSWHVWIAYADFLVHTIKDLQQARKAFKDMQSCHLAIDYPESVYEAWIMFEETWGTEKDLDFALRRVRKLTTALGEKRSKDAYKNMRSQTQVESQSGSSINPITLAAPELPQLQDVEMEGTDKTTEQSSKRKLDDEPGPAPKRLKQDTPPPPPKRDRENATVFVSGLQNNVSDSDLYNLFQDCGDIREIKISAIDPNHFATVEFVDSDRKRLQGGEISVHLAWQSTLYVTNFPERYDDAAIRELFGKYGTLFDVRWPSKKFKNTRRFCYVQYVSPTSARDAIVLDGFKLDENRPLSVATSDPQRRKERTDADANQREVYVAGLSKFVVTGDLETVFSKACQRLLHVFLINDLSIKYGPVKEMRLATDIDGRCKGFAFVEFGDRISALAALAANNYDMKGRRIAVTLADSRVRTKKLTPASGLSRRADAAHRSVRIRGLPSGAQEGLLQQRLEKLSEGVKRVEVFADEGQAVVEMDNAAHAGKLLLIREFDFQGHQASFSEEIVSTSTKGKVAKGLPVDDLMPPSSASSRRVI
ncbi:uncharacterized protein EI90DRAFT_3129468 [Cantharellus anzutake]|uniref:uncharacterized protein n=1 Tax=Cantharellus anzutake TaxID=1750568 RepID=UPI0019064603|nr:uncharacterized protein EI90DRAFT_3129468 [Cantharellus anzutake]KAF8324916.1 hypothetical protein EI90DRAFT_3129468 [Cantharellus anzutake]